MRRDTQDAAWESVKDELSERERRVCATIAAYGSAGYVRGFTCDTLEDFLGWSHQTTSATLSHLSRRGLVVDSGKRRKTRSGRDAIVWVLGTGTPKPKPRPTRTLLEEAMELLANAEPPNWWRDSDDWQQKRDALVDEYHKRN